MLQEGFGGILICHDVILFLFIYLAVWYYVDILRDYGNIFIFVTFYVT